MPTKINLTCPVCGGEKIYYEDDVQLEKACHVCGQVFEADSTCVNGHFVCHMCRQKAARRDIIDYCTASAHTQPFPLVSQLMLLPSVAMHGPEHHLLLTAALITAYCNQKGLEAALPQYLAEADQRSIEVPGGACGYWGICGAAIGAGIYMSIVTDSSPFAADEWKAAGGLTACCAQAVSGQGGPRCCKRDSFLSLIQAIEHSNAVLGTQFEVPGRITCDFYPNNEECKGLVCPFFPAKKG